MSLQYLCLSCLSSLQSPVSSLHTASCFLLPSLLVARLATAVHFSSPPCSSSQVTKTQFFFFYFHYLSCLSNISHFFHFCSYHSSTTQQVRTQRKPLSTSNIS